LEVCDGIAAKSWYVVDHLLPGTPMSFVLDVVFVSTTLAIGVHAASGKKLKIIPTFHNIS
jgi:hypothetical protein